MIKGKKSVTRVQYMNKSLILPRVQYMIKGQSLKYMIKDWIVTTIRVQYMINGRIVTSTNVQYMIKGRIGTHYQGTYMTKVG
jgi:hypothetical protein